VNDGCNKFTIVTSYSHVLTLPAALTAVSVSFRSHARQGVSGSILKRLEYCVVSLLSTIKGVSGRSAVAWALAVLSSVSGCTVPHTMDCT